MGVLALKLALAPLLVVGATLAGRRWGPRVSGILTALPIVAGPILLIVTIQHGEDFGARAARGSLVAIAALAAFCVVVARVGEGASGTAGSVGEGAGGAAAVAAEGARGAAGPADEGADGSRPWPLVLVAGWTAYAVVAAVVSRWDAPPLAGLAVALAALTPARLALGPSGAELTPRRPPPGWDLWARAVATGALVFAITTAADALGPAVSGVLTPFPIAMSVLAAFTLAHDGGAAAAALLRGFVTALPGFAAFFLVVALALA